MANDKKKINTAIKDPKTFYEKFENWFTKNDQKLFYILLGTCLFLSVISFNARISEAHDDALYLEGGSEYRDEQF